MKSRTFFGASLIGSAFVLGSGCRHFDAKLDEPSPVAGSGSGGTSEPGGGAGMRAVGSLAGQVATSAAGRDTGSEPEGAAGMAGQLSTDPAGAPSSGGAGGSAGSGGSVGSVSGSLGSAGVDHEPAAQCEPLLSNCWSPPWSTPTIPTRLDPALSASAVQLLKQAMAAWTSAPTPAGFLEFAMDTPPASGRQLSFSNDAGCGPRSLDDERLSFAMHDCETVTQVARELGVALGLPRAEQRIERDRYVELASESAFAVADECHGNFFARCNAVGGYPYDVGAFEPGSVMMGSGVSSAGAGCDLVPQGARLFVRKDVVDDVGTFKCESDVPSADSVTPRDKAMLVELYTLTRATSFRPVPQSPATDAVATVENLPVPTGITANLRATGDPAVAEQGHGFLQVLAFANDGALWRQGYSPLGTNYTPGWGDWILFTPLAPVGSGPAVSVVSSTREVFQSWLEGQPSPLEAVLSARGSVFAVSVPRDSAWTNLGAPPGGLVSSPAIAARAPDIVDVFAVGGDGQLWSRQFSGSDWSPWKSTSNLPDGVKLTAQPAAHYDARTDTMAVASRASDGALWFVLNGQGSSWSTWSKIGDSERTGSGAPALVSGVAGFQVLVRGAEGFLWRRENIATSDGLFEPLGGMLLGRPAADSTDGDGIDIVGVISDPITTLRALWHKRTW